MTHREGPRYSRSSRRLLAHFFRLACHIAVVLSTDSTEMEVVRLGCRLALGSNAAPRLESADQAQSHGLGGRTEESSTR